MALYAFKGKEGKGKKDLPLIPIKPSIPKERFRITFRDQSLRGFHCDMAIIDKDNNIVGINGDEVNYTYWFTKSEIKSRSSFKEADLCTIINDLRRQIEEDMPSPHAKWQIYLCSFINYVEEEKYYVKVA